MQKLCDSKTQILKYNETFFKKNIQSSPDDWENILKATKAAEEFKALTDDQIFSIYCVYHLQRGFSNSQAAWKMLAEKLKLAFKKILPAWTPEKNNFTDLMKTNNL